MGCGNPPVLDAKEEQQNDLPLTTKPSGTDDGSRAHGPNRFGADIMSFPSISLGNAHFPRHDVPGDCRSYPPECKNKNNRLVGHMNLNCLAYSKTDANLINISSDMSQFHRESEMSYPDVSMREACHEIDGNNTVPASCFMNTAVSSMDYSKSKVHMNFIPPRCETATGYPIKAHGADAKNSRINRSQMTGKFPSSECSTSVLPLVDNFDATGNKNNINILPPPFSSPQRVDANFLTLGIGGGTEIRSTSNFSTREIASKLEDAVSFQCNSSLVGQSPKNPSSLTQLTGRAARVQTNAGGLSSAGCNLASRMSTCNEDGLIGDTNARLNPIRSRGLQTPQAHLQSNISAKYDTLFDPTPSLLPLGSTAISQPDCVAPTPLGPEITNSTYLASRSISQKRDYHGKSFTNISSESSRNYLSDRNRGSSISHAQLGKLIPSTEGRGTQSSAGFHFPVSVQPVGNLSLLEEGTRKEVAKVGSFPSSVPPVGHFHTSHNAGSVEALGNSLFPQRTGFQISKGSTFQSAAAGPFPKRLGVQPNDFATVRTAKGDQQQTQNYGLVDYFQTPVRPPFAIGPPPIHLAPQVNHFRPWVSSGQHQHGMPPQLSKDFPRVDYSKGQVIPVPKLDIRPQASPIVSHPSLKRKATENSPAARLAPLRKNFPQPVIHHSTPYQRLSIPATPSPIPATVHIPPAPLHIKWQGFEGPPEPTGYKCLLCKRDLSFTAEGPVYQPATPPPVAVLPCGHTFHDHCLQIITPEDQLKSPPCIPCAIGEKT